MTNSCERFLIKLFGGVRATDKVNSVYHDPRRTKTSMLSYVDGASSQNAHRPRFLFLYFFKFGTKI